MIIKNFETSNSFCIDALLVNLVSAGCKTIFSEKNKNQVYLRCDDENSHKIGGILNYEFYLSPSIISKDTNETRLVCTDSSVVVTASEKD